MATGLHVATTLSALLLAAGHNGCLDCLSAIQKRTSQCPLCRAPFDRDKPLVPNTELRDLIGLATCLFMDEQVCWLRDGHMA